MTYLAVPIAAKEYDEATRQINAAIAKQAELIELRTDYILSLNVELVQKLINYARNASEKPLPLIITCRSKSQGGAIDYPDKTRIEILVAAIKAGVDFVDFEYESFRDMNNQEKIRLVLSQYSKTKLILSAHNFKERFDDLAGLYRHIMATYPAAIPKIVYTANHINDCFDALDLLWRTSGQRIVFAMGQAGFITRILAKKFGSFVTFASVDNTNATAPGQITVEQFRDLYRYDSIDKDTQLFGVIGDPVAHSMSPAVFNACFDKAGSNCLYLPILLQGKTDKFNDFMKSVIPRRWLGFKGFSVTIPHKENAINFVTHRQGYVEPLAEIIGSANTLVLGPDDNVSTYNTDYVGVLESIAAAGFKDLQGKKAAVIGAGGVARAVVAGLVSAAAKVKLYNRTVRKAERLAAEFKCDFAPLSDLDTVDAELLVNCTSIGMSPDIDKTPIPGEYLKKTMTVFDTVYNPPQTKLLRDAKTAKAKTISGVDMFISQAAEQYKLFTGKDADKKLMKKVVSEHLQC
ncbi:MAG: shikimate dehydrogenase [Phycisphaerae bacterium]